MILKLRKKDLCQQQYLECLTERHLIWQETNGHEDCSSYWSKTKISGCRQSSPLVISHHAVFTHKFLALPPLTVLWEFFHVLAHKYTPNQYTEKRTDYANWFWYCLLLLQRTDTNRANTGTLEASTISQMAALLLFTHLS